MIRILFLAALLSCWATMAAADPVSAIIIGLKTIGVSVAGIGAIGLGAIQLGVSLGLNLLAQALMGKPKAPGQTIGEMATGEATSQRTILGTFVTGGHLDYHGSHTNVGDTPRAYYTRVISLSDVPGVALNRVLMGDQWVTLGETADPDYGYPVTEYAFKGRDYCWIKFYDGNQTSADAMLVDKFGADPNQPWTSDAIGTGIAYAIVTARFNPKVWTGGLPPIKFEMTGIKVYDPRKDTTAGGSGAHRWANPATWEISDNLIVLAYNVARGIPLPGGEVYGGRIPAEDLPFSNWVAAMNVCDTFVGTGEDERRQFRGGLEIAFADDEPADVIDALLASCLGQISENGGVFRVRVGEPDVAALAITDGDWIITQPQRYDPHPGLQNTSNGVRVAHPSIDALWEVVQTEPLLDAEWEADDGDQRLLSAVRLVACPHHQQARQVGQAMAKDARRWRTHTGFLTPEFQQLEPLDTIEWTSARWPYSDKLFEVVEISYYPGTLLVAVTLRERDPEDYDIPAVDNGPQAGGVTAPGDRTIPVTAVTGVAVTDAASLQRRPAIRITWDPDLVEDAAALLCEAKVTATDELVAQKVVDASKGAVIVSAGIIGDTGYSARLQPVLGVPTEWSPWVAGTSADVEITDFNRQALPGEFAASGYTGVWQNVIQISLLDTDLATAWEIRAGGDYRRIAWEVDEYNSGIRSGRIRLLRELRKTAGDSFASAEVMNIELTALDYEWRAAVARDDWAGLYKEVRYTLQIDVDTSIVGTAPPPDESCHRDIFLIAKRNN